MIGLFAIDQYNNIFITLQSLAFFLLFVKLDFSSKAVNWVAASVTMIYLLNLHPIGVDLFTGTIQSIYAQFGSSVTFVLSTIGFCVTFFLVAILYDKLRLLSYKGIMKRISTKE